MTLEELAELKGLFRQVATLPSGKLQEKIEAVISRGVNKRYEAALKTANDALNKWRLSVREALSKQIPLKYVKRRRPASRPYPFKNSGNLQAGVKTKVRGTSRSKYYAITMRAEISAKNENLTDYALKLNEGKPRRKDGKIPRWKGFIDRVLHKGDTSLGIKSVEEIFNEIRKRLRG